MGSSGEDAGGKKKEAKRSAEANQTGLGILNPGHRNGEGHPEDPWECVGK